MLLKRPTLLGDGLQRGFVIRWRRHLSEQRPCRSKLSDSGDAQHVIAKSAEGDFATQRDVSRRKRDIETIRLKLLIDNPGERYVPGMLAEVYVPKDKLVAK